MRDPTQGVDERKLNDTRPTTVILTLTLTLTPQSLNVGTTIPGFENNLKHFQGSRGNIAHFSTKISSILGASKAWDEPVIMGGWSGILRLPHQTPSSQEPG